MVLSIVQWNLDITNFKVLGITNAFLYPSNRKIYEKDP